MKFTSLRWEDGRASCAPLLYGFSWDGLGSKLAPEPVGSEYPDAKPAHRSNARVRWTDMTEAHDGAQ
eukprot:15471442-Alexandrium_andersonii.AAC.1